MKIIVIALLAIIAAEATETIKWRGETLSLDVSVRNPSHIIFDEEIKSEIYPKEENINIIREGKDIYFRYNPFKKFKHVVGEKVKKIPQGLVYKGNKIKIWFIGKETGTSYALEINPVETTEDTFYIRNERASITKETKKAMLVPRSTRIISIAKAAARNDAIMGFTTKVYSRVVQNKKAYTVKHVRGYKGLVYDVDIYTVYAKKRVILDEFQFLGLPKKRKAYIGLMGGWKRPISKGGRAKVVVVSSK